MKAPSLHVLLTSGYVLETLAARGRLPMGMAILNKPYRKRSCPPYARS